MVVDIAPVGFVGGWKHFDFGAVLKLYVHPLAYGVLFGSDGIRLVIFLDGYPEILFVFFLRFRQHIFVDFQCPDRGPPRTDPPFCHLASPPFATTYHTTLRWK